MKIPASLKSEISYSRNVLKAGLDAVSTVRNEAPNQQIVPELARAVRSAGVPAAVGVAVGVLCGCVALKSRRGRGALVGGWVGGLIGLGAGVAWGSRKTTAAIAHQAAKNFSTVRDAHWVEKNPIAYA